MTVKELLTNISFDELLPILKKYATDHIHDIYIFREVYDILKAEFNLQMQQNSD